MQHNRTCDQLWKEGDKAGIIQETIRYILILVAVYQIRYLLKGKKADAKRQGKLFYFPVSMQKKIAVFQEKIAIFKIKQQPDIAKQAYEQNNFCRT